MRKRKGSGRFEKQGRIGNALLLTKCHQSGFFPAMQSDPPLFRASNLLWGGLLGAVVAFGLFFAGYTLKEPRPPMALDRATAVAYFDFISWPWFWGIVAVFALWSFLFNNRLGDALSDIYHWFN